MIFGLVADFKLFNQCVTIGLDNVSYIIMTVVDEKVILALLIIWNIWILPPFLNINKNHFLGSFN